MSYAALFVYKGQVAMIEREDKPDQPEWTDWSGWLSGVCGAAVDDIFGHRYVCDEWYEYGVKSDDFRFDVFSMSDLIEIESDYDDMRRWNIKNYKVINDHGYEVVNDGEILDVSKDCHATEEWIEPAFADYVG